MSKTFTPLHSWAEFHEAEDELRKYRRYLSITKQNVWDAENEQLKWRVEKWILDNTPINETPSRWVDLSNEF